jgi:GNAT superfamily N-acetyltransferase
MEYKIVSVQKDNLRIYSDLLTRAFPQAKKYTEAFLEWQYFQNPNGNVVGFDAFYGRELAAHYVTIPVVYIFNNRDIRGLLSLNTATDSNHQGKGLFTRLAMATYEAGKAEGYEFVIGVANQNSTHGFLKKLGFQLVSQLEVRVYMGKLQYNDPGPNIFRSHWNEAAAEWRLLNPEAVYLKQRSSVFSKTHLPFFKSLLTNNPAFAKNELQTLYLNPLKISIGLNLGTPTMSFNLPEKLKPSPLNLIFKSLSDADIKISDKNCYFELVDFDAY